MRDAVLTLLAVGVAWVIYKMTRGESGEPEALGELAELSDSAKALAATDEAVELSAAQSLVRPRVTFEERVNIASSGDASSGQTSSISVDDLPMLEGEA